MDEQQKMNITIGRYAQLLELETRVNIVVERIKHKEYIGVEDLLWALGTENAVEMAQKMRDEKERDARLCKHD